MKSNVKNIFIASSLIGAMVIAGIVIFISRKKRKDLEKKISEGNTDVIDASKDTDSSVVFPIKKGMGYNSVPENNAVRVVQRYLNMRIAENSYIGYSILEEDGKFGVKTEEALYKISGVLTVSYSLYQVMLKELTPEYLKADVKPSIDPKVSLFDYTTGLFH